MRVLCFALVGVLVLLSLPSTVSTNATDATPTAVAADTAGQPLIIDWGGDAGTVFGLVWLIINLPLMTVCTTWFWIRRKHQPIKARQPFLCVCNDVLLMCWLCALCFQRIYSDFYPCLLNLWTGFIGLLLLMTAYTWRCWTLYFTFHLTQARIQNQRLDTIPYFIRHRHYISAPFLFRVLGTLCIVLTLPCALLTAMQFQTLSVAGDTRCDKGWGDAALSIYFIFYATVFLFFAWRLREVKDVFGVQQELGMTGIIGVVCLVPWAIFNMVKSAELFNETVFPISTLCVLLAIAGVFFLSTAWPLYRSIYPKKNTLRFDGKLPDNVDTLTGILSSPEGLKAFKEFLTKEFSVENILFYCEVDEFRLEVAAASSNDIYDAMTVNQLLLPIAAKGLFKKYILTDAPFQVNLPSTVVLDLQDALKQFTKDPTGPISSRVTRTRTSTQASTRASTAENKDGDFPEHKNATIFDAAQDQIFKLMDTDSCPRFFRSDLYKVFCDKVCHMKHEAIIMKDMGVL